MGEPSATTANDIPPSLEDRGDVRVFARSARRRLWADSAARWVVGAGGVAVIASILGILVFLVVEVLPLFTAARVEPARSVALTGAAPEALLVDEHRTHAAVLGLDGAVRVWRLADGAMVLERPLLPEGGELRAVRASAADSRLLAATEDGRLMLVPVVFAIGFRGDDRFVTPEIGEPVVSSLDPAGSPLRAFTARTSEDTSTVAAQLADGRLVLERRTRVENFFTGEVHESEERRELTSPVPARELLLDGEQRNLYGIGEDGRLLWWRLSGTASDLPVLLSYGPAPVTAAALLIGERSLVAGRVDGSLDVWSQVLGEDGSIAPDHIRSFPSQGAPIRRITPSERNRSFLVQDAGGGLGLYHSTSGRTLWRGESPVAAASPAAYAPKGDAALLAGEGAARRARRLQSPPRVRTLHLLPEDPLRGLREGGLGLAVHRRNRRLRVEAEPHAAALRHAQGHRLLPASGGAAGGAGGDLHRPVHAPPAAEGGEAHHRDHGIAAQRGARLPGRSLARAAPGGRLPGVC